MYIIRFNSLDRSLVIRGSGRVSPLSLSLIAHTHTGVYRYLEYLSMYRFFNYKLPPCKACISRSSPSHRCAPLLLPAYRMCIWQESKKKKKKRERKLLQVSLSLCCRRLLSHAVICNFGCNLETITSYTRSRIASLLFFLISV